MMTGRSWSSACMRSHINYTSLCSFSWTMVSSWLSWPSTSTPSTWYRGLNSNILLYGISYPWCRNLFYCWLNRADIIMRFFAQNALKTPVILESPLPSLKTKFLCSIKKSPSSQITTSRFPISWVMYFGIVTSMRLESWQSPCMSYLVCVWSILEAVTIVTRLSWRS